MNDHITHGDDRESGACVQENRVRRVWWGSSARWLVRCWEGNWVGIVLEYDVDFFGREWRFVVFVKFWIRTSGNYF